MMCSRVSSPRMIKRTIVPSDVPVKRTHDRVRPLEAAGVQVAVLDERALQVVRRGRARDGRPLAGDQRLAYQPGERLAVPAGGGGQTVCLGEGVGDPGDGFASIDELLEAGGGAGHGVSSEMTVRPALYGVHPKSRWNCE